MAKKRGLGRSLEALLTKPSLSDDSALLESSDNATENSKERLAFLALDQIQRGKYQPRRDMDPDALQELAESIRAQGVIQPIVVRFLKAAGKANESWSAQQKSNLPATLPIEEAWVNDYIFIKTEYKIIKINLEDILFIEALKDYTKIYTHNLPVLTLRSLKSFETRLPADKFIRVHRSYLVSLNKINSVEKNTVMIANQSIPISDGYRDRFYDVINKYS